MGSKLNKAKLMALKEIFRAEGAACHGRDKAIVLAMHCCDVCGNRKPALGFDTSYYYGESVEEPSEYGPIWVCQHCINTVFDAYKE